MKIKQKIVLVIIVLLLLLLYWQYRAYMVQVTRDDVVDDISVTQ